MKCPLCDDDLAMGWWCRKCEMSSNDLASCKRFREVMAQPPWEVIWFFVGLAVIGLLIFLGTHNHGHPTLNGR